MKKFTLYSIGNSRDFNYYIFDKKNEVVEKLFRILSKILKNYFNLYESHEDKKGNCKQKSKEINFEKYFDVHLTNYEIRLDSKVDLFFGKKRIFVAVHCENKLRREFNEELFKFFKMPKPVKIENSKKIKIK